jgi:CRP-like cAMP-binding protein
MTTREQVLILHDDGTTAPQIAEALGVTPGYVFGILRDERPNRPHGNRGRRKSELRVAIRFHSTVEQMAPARIAEKLGVSRAYVYRILGES